MMQNNQRPIVIRALMHFLSFAPWKIAILNFSSIFMGLSASVGMLMVIPLAQLAGVDFQTESVESSPWGFLTYIAEWVNNLGFTKDLASILWVYAILATVIAVLTYARSMLAIKMQQDYIKKMRMQMYNILLSAKWEYLSSTRSSEFLHRLGGQVQSMNTAAQQIIALLHKLLTMSVYTTVMLMVNWQFTVMTFIVAIIVGIIVFPVRWSVRDAGERRLRGFQKIFRLLAEHLGSLKMIKSSGYEWDFQEKLREVSEELEEQQVRVSRAGSIVGFANSIGMAIGFCFMLYFAVTWLNVPIANFFLLLIIMARIMPQVAGLQQSIQSINYSLPAYRDIEETLDAAKAMQEAVVIEDDSRLGLKNNIEFRNVGFRYPGSNKIIIDKLNLDIPVKQTLALVGPSGIGKTTVADMIVGLLQPTQGVILFDGKTLHGDLIGQWRRSIAYVTQETYLFNDSIRNNLNWVNPDASDAELWQAIDTAALKECIQGLPQGLDSVIGDRGVRLSGGERQRLALARALLAKPDLLVLDEATSALDDKNERLIHQALINLHGTLTVIIIAHRETTIRHADMILNLGTTPPAVLTRDEFKNTIAIG